MLGFEQAIRGTTNDEQESSRPGQAPAELIMPFLDGDEVLLRQCYATIRARWQSQSVPQHWKDARIKVLHKKKDEAEYGNYRSSRKPTIPSTVNCCGRRSSSSECPKICLRPCASFMTAWEHGCGWTMELALTGSTWDSDSGRGVFWHRCGSTSSC